MLLLLLLFFAAMTFVFSQFEVVCAQLKSTVATSGHITNKLETQHTFFFN